MLQWRSQFYAVLVVVALLAVAFLGGFGNVTGQFGW
jgi:hypothetical protein